MKTNPFFILLLSSFLLQAGTPMLTVGHLQKLRGTRGEVSEKQLWDAAYDRKKYVFGKAPAKFLAENYAFIPFGAEILDVGVGEGRNAVFLASKGYKVTGIDISSVAVRKARNLAKEHGVSIKTIVGSLDQYRFSPQSFDAIIVFYWVNRKLLDKLQKLLKPGGVIVYESYTTLQKTKKTDYPLADDDYLLPQELLGFFGGFEILKFEEPKHDGDFRSSIIVRRPSKKAL